MTAEAPTPANRPLPSISIVAPSYNQGRYIARTVTGVLSQDYPKFDYLVCDGASTDDTLEVLAGFDDPRLSIVSEADHGQADAIRKGFERTTGDTVGMTHGIRSFLLAHLFGQLVLKSSALYLKTAYLTARSGLQSRVNAAVNLPASQKQG